jgi:predicted nucleic acid-binding protein
MLARHESERWPGFAGIRMQDYTRLAEIVEPAPLSAPVSRDPDDDVVLATALAARAALIVSGDQDLLVLGSFSDIRIFNAADALRALSAQ